MLLPPSGKIRNDKWSFTKTTGKPAGRNKVAGKTYWVPKSLVKSLRRNRIVSWSWSLSPKIQGERGKVQLYRGKVQLRVGEIRQMAP